MSIRDLKRSVSENGIPIIGGQPKAREICQINLKGDHVEILIAEPKMPMTKLRSTLFDAYCLIDDKVKAHTFLSTMANAGMPQEEKPAEPASPSPDSGPAPPDEAGETENPPVLEEQVSGEPLGVAHIS